MEIKLFSVIMVLFFLGLIYYLIKNTDKTIMLSKKIEKIERKLSRLIQNNESFTNLEIEKQKEDSQSKNDIEDKKLSLADQILSDPKRDNEDLENEDTDNQSITQPEFSEDDDDDNLNNNEKIIEGFNNVDYNDMISDKINLGSGTFYDTDYSNIYNNYVRNNLVDINNISDDKPSESYLSAKCRGLKSKKK